MSYRGFGRGRGGRNRPTHQREQARDGDVHSSVPSTTEVRPGAAVSIVLKQDQPTGREVRGVVQELLTRGDHPRGIKVRLVDGRVGRVQRMATGSSMEQAQDLQVPDHPSTHVSNVDPPQEASRTPRHRMVRDIRTEDPYLYTEDQQQASRNFGDDLVEAALLKPKKQKKSKKNGAQVEQQNPSPEAAPVSDLPAEQVTCPVCHDFDGDETAVAHHVNTYFT